MYQPETGQSPPPTTMTFFANLSDPFSLSLGLQMYWHLYINQNTNFPGAFMYCQLINELTSWDDNVSGSTNTLTTTGQFWLDGVLPYSAGGTVVPVTNLTSQIDMPFNDSPNMSGARPRSFASAFYRFNTYPYFEPNIAGSIPVALGHYYWGWDGALVYNTDLTISLTTSNVIAQLSLLKAPLCLAGLIPGMVIKQALIWLKAGIV